MASESDTALRLRDGRRLGYAEYGDPAGQPLFYFHGFPNSRLGVQFGAKAARERGVRLIAIDRPGIGLSDFQPGRTIGDWPNDVVELADVLGIERFAVLGYSGGGPYAAACALKIPDRVVAVAIVSGAGPFDERESTAGLSRTQRFFARLNGRFPWLMTAPMWLFAQWARRSPRTLVSAIHRAAPAADKALLARAEVSGALAADYRESVRQGARAIGWEARLYLRPWGFRLEEIGTEVQLWQGELDNVIPPSMGRYQAEAIPNCRARFYPGAGHLLIFERLEEILAALLP